MELNTQRVRARSGTRRAVAAVLLALVLVLAFSASAFADTPVSIRIEARTGTIVPLSAVSLGTNPVAPAGQSSSGTCPGNSVVGAIDTATKGTWTGTWSDGTGWSVDSVNGIDGTTGSGRRWVVYLNDVYLNAPPCQQTLNTGDRLIVYPLCTTGTAFCWGGGPMEFFPALPASQYLGASLTIQAWQLDTTFAPDGTGTTTRTRSVGATVTWPDGSVLTTNNPTDPVAGEAVVTFPTRGDQVVTLSKGNHLPDHTSICVSDGQDGYCGSSVPPPNPFDPLKFCTTTGDDGYCGSPDHVPPVGRITQPQPGHVFPKSGRPRLLKGTVDFDPSEIDHVDIRLMRQTTVTAYRVKKRRVTVTKTVHGKTVRKRVLKKIRVPYKKQGCFGWNVAASEWKALKKCDASLAGKFRADGADVWQYQFLVALPPGGYTLDALAADGAGNVDKTMEAGRNRVSFKVN
jgi:hypothetical protein